MASYLHYEFRLNPLSLNLPAGTDLTVLKTNIGKYIDSRNAHKEASIRRYLINAGRGDCFVPGISHHPDTFEIIDCPPDQDVRNNSVRIYEKNVPVEGPGYGISLDWLVHDAANFLMSHQIMDPAYNGEPDE